MSDILETLIQKDFTKINSHELSNLKREWASKIGKTPKDSEVLEAYRELIKQGKLPYKKSIINH